MSTVNYCEATYLVGLALLTYLLQPHRLDTSIQRRIVMKPDPAEKSPVTEITEADLEKEVTGGASLAITTSGTSFSVKLLTTNRPKLIAVHL